MLLLPYAIRASSERPRCPDDYSPSDHGPRVHRSELVLAYSIDPNAVVCCRPASYRLILLGIKHSGDNITRAGLQ